MTESGVCEPDLRSLAVCSSERLAMCEDQPNTSNVAAEAGRDDRSHGAAVHV